MTQVAPQAARTPVSATKRRPATKTRRKAVVALYGPLCAHSGCVLPGVELDHRVPLAMGGADELSNWQLLCPLHHLAKTAIDVTAIAKAKRLAGETCTGPKRPIPAHVNPWQAGRKLQSRPFQCNKSSARATK